MPSGSAARIASGSKRQGDGCASSNRESTECRSMMTSSSGAATCSRSNRSDRVTRGQAASVRLQGTSADRSEYQKIRHFLSQSATGRAALAFVDRHDLKVRFAPGRGSFWDGKEIVLSRRDSFQSTALTLVHEVE